VNVVAIAIAAVLGALSRYGIERVVPAGADGTAYLATLIVNLTGALALGLALGALGHRFAAHPNLRLFVTVGFLSSYTTFSALAFQTVHLAERGRVAVAAVYVAGSVTGGVVLAYAGLVAGRAL
jgi:fluoride exporter